MSFIGNRAKESGGAIYAEFPLIQFSINVLNRLCFIQYNDGTGSDVPPQNWQVYFSAASSDYHTMWWSILCVYSTVMVV